MENQVETFIRQLAEKGGKIVSSAACTPEQINEAREQGRMLVLEDGLGFVWIASDREWLSRMAEAEDKQVVDIGAWPSAEKFDQGHGAGY